MATSKCLMLKSSGTKPTELLDIAGEVRTLGEIHMNSPWHPFSTILWGNMRNPHFWGLHPATSAFFHGEPMLNFDVQWLNYQSHEPRNAGVAVRGWRLFDLVVQVNKLTLTTFVPGATLGFPLKKHWNMWKPWLNGMDVEITTCQTNIRRLWKMSGINLNNWGFSMI